MLLYLKVRRLSSAEPWCWRDLLLTPSFLQRICYTSYFTVNKLLTLCVFQHEQSVCERWSSCRVSELRRRGCRCGPKLRWALIVHVFFNKKYEIWSIQLLMNGVVSSDSGGAYLPDETWAAPSVPLTNGFRYNTSEPRGTYNQNSNPNPFTEYDTHTHLSYHALLFAVDVQRCRWTDGY